MKSGDSNAWKLAGPTLRVVVLMLVLTGLAYPFSLLLTGQVLFPVQSNGSMVSFNGRDIGSALIAQNFTSAKFFHPRVPSASGSGVDPHITPEDAYSQVAKISNATGIAVNPLKTLVRLNIETNRAQNLGVFAPDYVNVLAINLDLVDQYPNVYKDFVHQTNSTQAGK